MYVSHTKENYITEEQNELIVKWSRLAYWFPNKYYKNESMDLREELIGVCLLQLVKSAKTFNKNFISEKTGKPLSPSTYFTRGFKFACAAYLRENSNIKYDTGIDFSLNEVCDYRYEKEENSEMEECLDKIQCKGLQCLKDREKELMRYLYGLDNYPKLTYRSIAKELNISRERVRQLNLKSLEKLRKYYKIRELEEVV